MRGKSAATTIKNRFKVTDRRVDEFRPVVEAFGAELAVSGCNVFACTGPLAAPDWRRLAVFFPR